MDTPEIYANLGFVTPEGSFLADPCLKLDFAVDYLGEVAGTQVRLSRTRILRMCVCVCVCGVSRTFLSGPLLCAGYALFQRAAGCIGHLSISHQHNLLS